MVSRTPYLINPASSKLGLLWTDGSSHRCMNVLDPSLAAELLASSDRDGLEKRDRDALVLEEIMMLGLASRVAGCPQPWPRDGQRSSREV
jgi:hypothetical protein